MPKFMPTHEQRALVEKLAAVGVPAKDIGGMLEPPVHEDTIFRHFKAELTNGVTKANAAVAQRLYKKAIEGDTVSMIFWLKTRARWREQHHVDVTSNQETLGAKLSTEEIVKAVKKLNEPKEDSE